MSAFAHRLNRAMKDKKMSQTDLAKKLGVKPQSVQKWCSNITLPRRERMKKIALLFDWKVSEDLTGLEYSRCQEVIDKIQYHSERLGHYKHMLSEYYE